jgi:WD40 repeat protein
MDFKDMKVVKELKPSGKMSRIINEIRDSKYLLVLSSDQERVSYIDIYDAKDYSNIFSQKRESLYFIMELSTGNFVMSYEDGKIEIASIDLDTKTINVVQVLKSHTSDVYDVKELSDGKLVSCSNNGQIIFWSLNPSLNIYEEFKSLNAYPNEYSSLL